MTKQDSPLSPAILLERLKKAAAAANMQILDERWYGWARYHLRCPAGHVWSYSAQRIASGAPLVCPECWGIRQLVRLTAATEPNGSTCLDTHWHGANSKYRFRCTAGHLWERSAINVLYNGATVCPQCTRQASGSETKTEQSADGLERLRATAAAHGGQLLDDRYLGAAARYRFRCAQGHEWETQGSNIWSGHWCPHCGQGAYRTGIAALQAIAAQRGGQCLSQAYQNEDTELTWMCGKEHVWQATGKRIKNGHWCPQCARGESPPLGLNETHTANSDSQRYRTARRGTQLRADGLERLRAAAAAHGGQLLDEYYFGVAARYQFRCARGHEWETAGNAVLRGSWCWRCHVEDRGLASRNPEGLARLQAAAAAKGGICLSQTYTGQKTRYQFRCAQGHEWETQGNEVLRGRWCRRCSHEALGRGRRDPEGLARLQAAAAAKGGVCLSQTYTVQSARYRFRCARGHEWEVPGDQVISGSWCRRCCDQDKSLSCLDSEGLARLQAAAAAKGGVCLSQTYTGQKTRYRFRCAQGHEWETPGNAVFSGKWCRRCSHEEMSRARRDPEGLARLQAAAAARGGVCLSETFTNQDARYRFRCAQGHEWETLGMVILRGAWCSRCAYDAQRDNIEIFQEIAVQRGGQCLSQVYHDCETKLTWMCHKGHVWNATPEGVKRGHWCPECAHANKITRANSKARMRYGVSPL